MIRNIKILYVEDEEVIRENTKRPLNYLCDELFIASNGQEGLEIYKQNLPDIVISDIRMPYMNGIEMSKAIKKIKPNQYIIFTTAHSESNYFIDAIDMQVDGYILKPIDYKLLESKINNIIEQITLKVKNQHQQELLQQQKLNILEQSKNAQMGEMIGNIAHQWRQPLSVISTSASGMQVEKDMNILNDEKFKDYTNLIMKNTEFLSKTIDIFRDYIKEDKEKKTVVLQDRINIAIDITKSSLKNNYIRIINNINNMEVIQITMVVGELSQVIINILNNSKDIIKEKMLNDGWIKIDLKKIGNNAIITIEDNGGGVPSSIIDKIFDPYFTTKHKLIGTGLGLHMSKEIIEKSLNGNLSIKNSDNGAVFTIMLPLS